MGFYTLLFIFFVILIFVIFAFLYKLYKTMELLEIEKQKLKNIIDGANVGTWEWRVQKGEEDINERWAEIIGYTIEELAPVSIDTWEKFCHPDDLKKAKESLNQHFRRESNSYACDFRMRHKNGTWVWVHSRGKVAKWSPDNKPLHMFGTHQDITLQKQYEEQIYHQANYESLTGLANRHLAESRMNLTIEMANRNNRHVGILFIDLNKFKSVNDQYGHEAGDYLLKEAAKRISNCIRKNDTASRIGGDEFIVILADLKCKENSKRVAEAIIQTLSQPFLFNDIKITIGVSIGIATYPDDGLEQKTLIKLADASMYKIKQTGKNGYGFV